MLKKLYEAKRKPNNANIYGASDSQIENEYQGNEILERRSLKNFRKNKNK